MATEKTWYTGIKNARGEGTDSKEIADWYLESDSGLNPYSYRNVPKDLTKFYLYVLQVLKSVNTPDDILRPINKSIQILLQKEHENKYKIFCALTYVIHRYNTLCSELEKLKCAKNVLQFQNTDYLNFIPNAIEKLGNIVTFLKTIDMDSIFSEIIVNYENPLQDDTYIAIFYDLYINGINSIKVGQDKNLTSKLREEYLVKLLLELISCNPQEYYKTILEHLPSYADMFPLNFIGERILSRAVLEGFKRYMSEIKDPILLQNYMYIFLDKLLEFKDNRSITNESLLYDAFDLIETELDTGEKIRPFQTYRFRHDFSKTTGLAKEFSEKELQNISNCFYEQKQNFSTFINILGTNTNKQGVIDSLLIFMPGCKGILSEAGLAASEEKQLNLKNESEEQEDKLQEALFAAIQEGKKQKVASLIASGADINKEKVMTSPFGDISVCPLTFAIRTGQTEIANYLINQYANVDTKDPDGNTPLMFAVIFDNLIIVQSLLLLPADVSIRNDKGQTALDMAKDYLQYNKPNTKAIINLLIPAEQPGGLSAVQTAIESKAKATVQQPSDKADVTIQQTDPLALKSIQQTGTPGQVKLNVGGVSMLVIAQYPESLSLQERQTIALEQIARIKQKKYLLSLLLMGRESQFTTLQSSSSSSKNPTNNNNENNL